MVQYFHRYDLQTEEQGSLMEQPKPDDDYKEVDVEWETNDCSRNSNHSLYFVNCIMNAKRWWKERW